MPAELLPMMGREPDQVIQKEDGTFCGCFESKENERTWLEYIHWKDFITNPARVWEEVRWVGRRV